MRLSFEEGEREVIRARLGLAEDANDEAIATAMAEWVQEDPEASNNGGGGGGGESADDDTNDDDIDASGDGVYVDVTEFRRLKQQEKRAAQIEAAERRRDRDELIEEAIADGKFSPSRRDHYKERYDSDPDGTKKLLGRLAPNTVPLEARGADTPTDEVESTAYPTDWLGPNEAPEQHGRQQPTREVSSGRSRIHGED
jgi:hypothetical protein